MTTTYLLTHQPFGEALEIMKHGGSATHTGLSGSVSVVAGAYDASDPHAVLDSFVPLHLFEPSGEGVVTRFPHLVLTTDEGIQAWSPSAADVLREDWMINPIKTQEDPE